MAQLKKMLEQNKKYYKRLYAKGESFLQYPVNWIICFHHMYLKKHLPKGKVLDYGCGTANNSIFFIEKGYDVWGVDVSENSLPLIKKNLTKFLLMTPNIASMAIGSLSILCGTKSI